MSQKTKTNQDELFDELELWEAASDEDFEAFEDAEDLAWLKESRRKGIHYRSLEEYSTDD
jgi:hypothetical protein